MMTENFNGSERVKCSRKITGTALLLSLAVLSWLPSANAQQPVSAKAASKLSYEATAGQVFELQGSNDLAVWRDVGDVVFGDGKRVSDHLSGDPRRDDFRFFRVKIAPAQTFGFAPIYLLGKTIAFNDEGASQTVSFDSRSSATLGEESKTYRYRKLGDTIARLDFTSGDTITERIDLEFVADLVGNYTRTKWVAGRVDDIDRGTFALGSAPLTHSPDSPATIIPESLVGLTYLFSDGDNSERLDFVTNTRGRAVDGATVLHFTYDYLQDNRSSIVTVHYHGEISVQYELRQGETSAGTFLRHESVDGILDHTSEGIFSSAASVYHTPGAESTTVTLPADELTGRTYVMLDGGTPCRLQFDDLLNGRCIEGSQVDEFEFDYAVDCAST
ncbi:MAG: hypothetical protein ACI9MB_002075, partial [Verrucomicrobiales bacterium]